MGEERHIAYRHLIIGALAGLAIFGFAQAGRAAAPAAGIVSLDGVRQATFSRILTGSSLATGDIDRDGADELVVGTPPGQHAAISIYELDGRLIRAFTVFSGESFGLTVALGNFSGRGSLDIAVAPRRGGGPRVLFYDQLGKKLSPGFYAYASGFHGGVSLATGDVDGDGADEILTAPLTGGGPHVSFFRSNGTRLGNLFPFESTYRGGLSLAAVDLNGDGKMEIAAAPQGNRITEVRISDAWSRQVLVTAKPFGNFTGGAQLRLLNQGSTTELVASAGPGGGPQVVSLNLTTGTRGSISEFPLPRNWRGGLTAIAVDHDGDGQASLIVSAGGITLTPDQIAAYVASFSAPVGSSVTYEKRTLTTTRGSFAADIVKVNLADPDIRVLTTSSYRYDCADNCPVSSLGDHVKRVTGVAGVNGSYFCPSDYPACMNSDGSTYWMWFDSPTGTFTNAKQNKFNTGPLVAFDTLNRPTLYSQALDWTDRATYEAAVGQKLRAEASNGPLLIKNGSVVVTSGQLDNKQLTVRSNRSGLAVKGTTLYLVVARSSTVLDLGAVMKALGVDTAINLDGGGSSALYYNGAYKVGPGRDIPNALVIAQF